MPGFYDFVVGFKFFYLCFGVAVFNLAVWFVGSCLWVKCVGV
jgi:hypothetical protein